MERVRVSRTSLLAVNKIQFTSVQGTATRNPQAKKTSYEKDAFSIRREVYLLIIDRDEGGNLQVEIKATT